jgi:hypothetical protein
MSLPRQANPYHLSFFLISLAGLVLNTAEGTTVFFGMITGNTEAAVIANRSDGNGSDQSYLYHASSSPGDHP